MAKLSAIFFASHASSLIEALTAQNIPFQNVNKPCTASDSAMVAYIGIALIVVGIAMLAFVFSLSRPRQQFIEAIETYGRRLRNSIKMTPSQNPNNRLPLNRPVDSGYCLELIKPKIAFA